MVNESADGAVECYGAVACCTTWVQSLHQLSGIGLELVLLDKGQIDASLASWSHPTIDLLFGRVSSESWLHIDCGVFSCNLFDICALATSTGLTKLVSQLTREGQWAKALEVYEALPSIGIAPDTTITNAAITTCDKGGQWERALEVFR